jgi:DNA-directed RNA polymerase delta subunit
VKRPQKAIAIRKALQDGGIHTVSTDFYAVVLTTLKRNEEFVHLQNKEWGLSEWYGGRIRKRGKVEDGKKEGAEDQAEESGD